MAWAAEIDSLTEHHGRCCRLLRDGKVVTYVEVIDRWRSDPEFVDEFIDVLSDAPLRAMYFETPPICRNALGRHFEFVLIEAPALVGLEPDPWVFGEYFRSDDVRDGITAFPNLGLDARLVAPCPTEPERDYAHLAAFVRNAPREQQHALWHRVGDAAAEWLSGEEPVWISTSGDGVAWLHVRLDRFPKYYNFAPYREIEAG